MKGNCKNKGFLGIELVCNWDLGPETWVDRNCPTFLVNVGRGL